MSFFTNSLVSRISVFSSLWLFSSLEMQSRFRWRKAVHFPFRKAWRILFIEGLPFNVIMLWVLMVIKWDVVSCVRNIARRFWNTHYSDWAILVTFKTHITNNRGPEKWGKVSIYVLASGTDKGPLVAILSKALSVPWSCFCAFALLKLDLFLGNENSSCH